MDGASLSPCPQHSWLHFRVSGTPATRPLAFHMQGVAHALSLTMRGVHEVRWITRGSERRWHEAAGTVHFLPRDGESHAFVTRMSPDCNSAVFLIPRRHLRTCLTSEGLAAPAEFGRVLADNDPLLRDSLTRLVAAGASSADTAALAADEAARRIVLQLAERSGAGQPDWHADGSTFDGRTVADLVCYIDAHLRIAPGLVDLALLTGLSPSHFARKFRISTGLSVHRFINRRRLLRSLTALRAPRASLADVSLDLGFSSQSHFSRLFRSLTGMTPARYARQFQATVG